MTELNAFSGRDTGAPTRTLHILDIENLAGRADPSAADIVATLAEYGMVSGRRQGDLVWMSCSSAQTMANIALASHGTGVACKPGRDGAEHAIEDALDWTWVARTFLAVVIGSGDHFFAPRIAWLASRGVQVTCVARERSLSAANRLASSQVRLLPSSRLTSHLPGGHGVVA